MDLEDSRSKQTRVRPGMWDVSLALVTASRLDLTSRPLFVSGMNVNKCQS